MFINLETSKVNLDPPDQLGACAIPTQQTSTHQLIHAEENLCGAKKAKEEFLQEVEEKEQQMRQVAPKKEKPVLHIKRVRELTRTSCSFYLIHLNTLLGGDERELVPSYIEEEAGEEEGASHEHCLCQRYDGQCPSVIVVMKKVKRVEYCAVTSFFPEIWRAKLA